MVESRDEARPLIAINGEATEDGVPKGVLPLRYAEAVWRAGGLPLTLAPIADPRHLDELLAQAHGIVLAGGDDFDTECLGLGPTHPAAKPVPRTKQDFDFVLVREVLARDLPVLGICYGMQAMALAEGGDLFQHLSDLPEHRDHRGGVEHEVLPEPETKLAGLMGIAPLTVVSRHHQALSRTGPAWSVCARDDRGLIEAIERTEHTFAIGVQWHPELSPAGSPQDRLFAGLVEAANTRRHEHVAYAGRGTR